MLIRRNKKANKVPFKTKINEREREREREREGDTMQEIENEEKEKDKEVLSLSALQQVWVDFYHSYIQEDGINQVTHTSKGKKIRKREEPTSTPTTTTTPTKQQAKEGHYLQVIREMPVNSELTLIIDYDDLAKAAVMNQPQNQTIKIIDHLENEADFSLDAAKEAMLQVMRDSGTLGAGYARDYIYDLRIAIINPPLKIKIPQINHHMLSKLVTFDGIVNATDEHTRFMFVKAGMECKDCGKVVDILGRPNPNKTYRCDDCKSVLRLDMRLSVGHTFQAIKVQERPDTTLDGRVAQDKEVRITNQEYLNLVKNGDYVTVSGIVRIDQDKISRSPVYDFYIDALHVELKHEDFMTEFDPILAEEVQSAIQPKTEDADFEKLWRSVGPTVTGHKPVKIALLSLMAGAPAWRLKDNSRLRGDINLLFCGDSDTFKSVFAKWLGPIMPRFLYNSGESSSIAGLMATATYSNSVPTLQGGAYMMASGGVCVLDELDKYTENDRQRLLEVLDNDQTMTIRKLGIHKILHARCSTIGISNPIAGDWDTQLSFEENTSFKRSWYSRFDLIFRFIDKPDKDKDTSNAEHYLDHYYAGSSEEEYEKQRTSGLTKTKYITIETKSGPKQYYSPAFMAHWVRHVRANFKEPKLTPGSKASNVILTSYLKLRGFDVAHMTREEINRRLSKIGPRQLGGLIRLAKASARAHMRNTVEEKDAKLAVWLVKESIKSAGTNILPQTDDFITTAPVSTIAAATEFGADFSLLSQKDVDKISKTEHGPRSRFLKVMRRAATTACTLCRHGRKSDGSECDNCSRGMMGTIFSKSTFFAECESVDIDVRYIKHYWEYCEGQGYVKYRGRADTYELTDAGFQFIDRGIAYKEFPGLGQKIMVEQKDNQNNIMDKIKEEMAGIKVDPTDKLLRADLEEEDVADEDEEAPGEEEEVEEDEGYEP